MLANTKDGVLELSERWQQPTVYLMDWDETLARRIVAEFQVLEAALQQLGNYKWWEDTPAVPAALMPVYQQYFTPFSHTQALEKCAVRLSESVFLSNRPKTLVDAYENWFLHNVRSRLPDDWCDATELFRQVHRYMQMLNTHKVFELEVSRRLAEALTLYRGRRANTHVCRCCQHAWDLARSDNGLYESICPVCGWQEDYFEEEDFSSANRNTLKRCRKSFRDNPTEPLERFPVQFPKTNLP